MPFATLPRNSDFGSPLPLEPIIITSTFEVFANLINKLTVSLPKRIFCFKSIPFLAALVFALSRNSCANLDKSQISIKGSHQVFR